MGVEESIADVTGANNLALYVPVINKGNSLSNKMFFYIDGSDKIKIDKIDKCTLNFSERHYEVEIEKFE